MLYRAKHLGNPSISYYNINSLRNKFFDIQDLASKTLPDILVLAETKIDNKFKSSEFLLEGYYHPHRKDYSSNSGGLIQYVRNGIIYSHKPEYELANFESISTEFTFNKKNGWFYPFIEPNGAKTKMTILKIFFFN